MSESEKIKQAFERTVKTFSLKPSLGLGTGVSKTRIKNGLTCEIQEGRWKFLADMPASVGGNDEGPTPGVYGRAALGSCLAVGYMLRASAMGITIDALEVEVQADYDDGGLFGTGDKDPGYQEVRYTVTIESEATEEDILKLLDEADKHSPYLDVFTRGQACKREVHIISPKTQS